jgi:voltage-gated potassium channel|tara:strand:+ start:6589 stop:7338 length:750 start_codon:yes stop_codon:yes gene_type:complete
MSVRQIAKKMVDDTDTLSGRVFNYVIYILIILSLVSFSIETLPGIPEDLDTVLGYLEVVVILIFTLEYLLRLWTADQKLVFMFSFFGLIDLIAILPFYLTIGIDLRSARSFRLLRLFILLKIFRFSQASRRLIDCIMLVREELILFAFLTLILLWLSAIGIYYFEHDAQPDKFESVFHSLWWAVATITTVGYGDVYPVTIGGRLFTFIVLLIGMGVIAVPAGLLAASLTRIVQREREQEEEQQRQEGLD